MIVTAVFSVVGGGALLLQLSSSLTRSVDTSLTVQCRALSASLGAGQSLNPVPASVGEAAFFQVVGTRGRVLFSSPSVEGQDPLVKVTPRGTSTTFITMSTAPIGTQDRYRVCAQRASYHGSPVVVVVGQSLRSSDQSLHDVRGLLLLAGPLLLALVGSLTWLLVGRALAPVESIRSKVAELSLQNLGERIPEPDSGDEIARLASTMNDMLERLNRSHRLQQAFVSDASHELKSPLAAAYTEVEVSLAHPDVTDWARSARDLLGDLERMRRIIDDLLVLAQHDEGSRSREREVVDIAAITQSECDDASRWSPVPIECHAASPLHVEANASDLSRAIRNVVENAVRHATSQVVVNVLSHADEVDVNVFDDGPGIAETDRERIFDRFTRLDEARSREAGGSGLGLAIARAVMERHGGSVWLESTSPRTQFVLRLPLAPFTPTDSSSGDSR